MTQHHVVGWLAKPMGVINFSGIMAIFHFKQQRALAMSSVHKIFSPEQGTYSILGNDDSNRVDVLCHFSSSNSTVQPLVLIVLDDMDAACIEYEMNLLAIDHDKHNTQKTANFLKQKSTKDSKLPVAASPNSSPQDVDDHFRTMTEMGLISNVVAVLEGRCNDGLIQGTMNLFGLMPHQGKIPEIVIYMVVVDNYCMALKFEDEKGVFRKLKKFVVSSNAFSNTVFVQGLCKGQQKEEVIRFCLEMLEGGHSRLVATYIGLVEHRSEEAPCVIQHMSEKWQRAGAEVHRLVGVSAWTVVVVAVTLQQCVQHFQNSAVVALLGWAREPLPIFQLSAMEAMQQWTPQKKLTSVRSDEDEQYLQYVEHVNVSQVASIAHGNQGHATVLTAIQICANKLSTRTLIGPSLGQQHSSVYWKKSCSTFYSNSIQCIAGVCGAVLTRQKTVLPTVPLLRPV